MAWCAVHVDPQGFAMYRWSKKKGCWVGKRGTSQQEGCHRHLNGLPVGSSCGMVYFLNLASGFIHRWNVQAGINNLDEVDYGTPDHRHLHHIKRIAAEMQWVDRY